MTRFAYVVASLLAIPVLALNFMLVGIAIDEGGVWTVPIALLGCGFYFGILRLADLSKVPFLIAFVQVCGAGYVVLLVITTAYLTISHEQFLLPRFGALGAVGACLWAYLRLSGAKSVPRTQRS